MANLNLRVSEELKAKFDACAPLYGGRPALLRQLLAKVTGPVEAPPPSPKRQDLRTFVRLSAEETSAVAQAAADRGLRASQWIRALVRRRLFGEPRFLRSEELALYAILTQLEVIARRLGRVADGEVGEGAEESTEIVQLIEEARQEVRGHIGDIRKAFLGNLAYWAAPDDL